MIDKYLIEHCAPTLASMKTASLFCMAYIAPDVLQFQIESYNTKLKPKGIQIEILKNTDRPLIYVYRTKQLIRDLSYTYVANFLKIYGYEYQTVEAALMHLKERITILNEFPHEIGLFLGYPYEDVIGFITNEGKNSKCCGCWKVYCNEWEAIRLFEKYKKCKSVYSQLWRRGRSIAKLTVTA